MSTPEDDVSQADGPAQPDDERDDQQAGRKVLASSAVMAAGTVFSRLSGLIRSLMLLAALGNQLHADQFAIANTIPTNSLIFPPPIDARFRFIAAQSLRRARPQPCPRRSP